jgi:hypothetical protein
VNIRWIQFLQTYFADRISYTIGASCKMLMVFTVFYNISYTIFGFGLLWLFVFSVTQFLLTGNALTCVKKYFDKKLFPSLLLLLG